MDKTCSWCNIITHLLKILK